MATRSEKKLQRSEKRKRRNSIIIGLILVSLMFVSIIGYSQNTSQSQTGSDFVYNGFTFKPELINNNNNMIFIALMNDQEIGYFYTQPKDAESIEVPENFKYDLLSTKSVVVVQSPLGLDGSADVGRVYVDRLSSDLKTVGGMEVLQGISTKDLFDEKPVYTCEDATADKVLLVYTGEYTGPAKISKLDDYCYSLDAQSIDILTLRDKILYLKMNIQ